MKNPATEKLQFPTGLTVRSARKHAKALKTSDGIPLSQALDRVAADNGLMMPWSAALEKLKNQKTMPQLSYDVSPTPPVKGLSPELTEHYETLVIDNEPKLPLYVAPILSLGEDKWTKIPASQNGVEDNVVFMPHTPGYGYKDQERDQFMRQAILEGKKVLFLDIDEQDDNTGSFSP